MFTGLRPQERTATRLSSAAHRGGPALALGLAAAVTAISACSSSSSNSVENPQNQQGSYSAAPSHVQDYPTLSSASAVPANAATSAAAEITANWNKFFDPATPASMRVTLLQNGAAFASSISSLSSGSLSSTVSSKVDSVTLGSATQAAVKYDLTAKGTSVAKGASGISVLQDGIWKVGDDAFCGLLTKARSLGVSVTVPAACKSAS